MDNQILAELYGDIYHHQKNLTESFKNLRDYHLSMVSGTKTPHIPSLRGQKLPTGEKNSPKEFLTTPKHNAWGKNFVDNAIRYKITNVARADKYKNYWVADEQQRLGWRAVCEDEFEKVYTRVVDFIEQCQESINECDLKTFNEKFDCSIKPTKWKRREAILDGKVTYKGFIKLCRTEHRRLPKLRG